MRKNNGILAVGVIYCMVAISCSASGWGLMGAYWNTADGSDSIGAGGRLSVEMIRGIQLELRVTHFSDIASDKAGYSIDLEATPLELSMVYFHPLMDRLSVYGGAGIGKYYFSADVRGPEVVTTRGETGNQTGSHLVLGTEWTLLDSGALYGATQAIIFGELMYRIVNARNLLPEPAPEGTRFGRADLNGVGVNIGLMMRW